MLLDCLGSPLRHFHNVETRFYCPQPFLSVNFQCRDDVSELRQTFWDWKEPLVIARWPVLAS